MSSPTLRPPSAWMFPALVIGFAVLLPVTASALRPRAAPGCATDGVALREPPAVRIGDAEGGFHAFCCIGCAKRWIAAFATKPPRIDVRDETTNTPIAAARAHYAWSPVVVQPATGDRWHAFARAEDAREHAAFFGGRLLTDAERPFGAPHAATTKGQQ